ncbi:terminase large subunit [Variovorax phage VarioGold]|uniref:terminase large subunit n=1 Tax=Variovorax sp. ZS18.2.2 TaxID=2971255 RepID=UPI0021512E00|nr:terminase TerL endonuclease subunit [Variovorax sp. ZS18.2.2]MCR6477535.1 terminase large subunit [Variovorax sp. ZS18.2.2]UYD72050.1 terminase large subunit [Variovorax phage VarioGold]
MATYAERALAYAQRVVDGRETAGKFERLACKRYLRDLERQGTPEFPFIVNDRAGSRECQFIELLSHIKGEWAKPIYVDGRITYAKIRLEDWQVFIEYNLFAWVHMDTGLRRFRRSYEEIARKNAKSTRVAGRQLYLCFADHEPGAQSYSAATTGEQAREVFDTAREMVLRDSEFRQRFGVTVGRHDITAAHNASTFKVLNAEASTQDGLNVHSAAVDEVHAHKKRDLWDVIESADGSRSQPMISAITTAGKDMSGICYELRGYTIKVLEGTHTDETWFGIIFTIDEGDDWKDPKVWRKANPNLGISVKVDKLMAACSKAQATPSARGNFLTKHLNVWTNAGVAWMDMEYWAQCKDTSIREEDFKGEVGYGGLDLAEKKDFAAKAKVFERAGLYYLFVTLYHNEYAVQESSNAQLLGWVEEGYVKVNEGNLTDFDVIADDLRADAKLHQLEEVAFDPALSMYFARKLLDEGLPLVEIQQKAMYFTQVLLQLENLVLAGKIRHDGNPVLTWMISNLVVKKSKFNELLSPTKDREDDKIDGALAALMAFGRALGMEVSDEVQQGFVSL